MCLEVMGAPGTRRARRVGQVPAPRVRETARMVQRVHTVVIDDLDGASPADETVRFAIDGTAYEIDLKSRNAAALRKVLKPYTDAGRRVRPDRRRARNKSALEETRRIKAWARENGVAVADRGRVSRQVRAAYTAATVGPGSAAETAAGEAV